MGHWKRQPAAFPGGWRFAVFLSHDATSSRRHGSPDTGIFTPCRTVEGVYEHRLEPECKIPCFRRDRLWFYPGVVLCSSALSRYRYFCGRRGANLQAAASLLLDCVYYTLACGGGCGLFSAGSGQIAGLGTGGAIPSPDRRCVNVSVLYIYTSPSPNVGLFQEYGWKVINIKTKTCGKHLLPAARGVFHFTMK